ncbi:uncharacterized protein JN550_006312 [Neoarthrinium moseri]|uniref:uncharacterized protein n=1 Tax=Neoarthrinium moseri TaxID=1658444 RepID=UPI001FDD1E72|nr:uncharacterized protein JN550_006312 [Neoarthrinium moseri]KAI1868737.1 hypothetical protein JN550_006312 [Neoarthrinium moseri]
MESSHYAIFPTVEPILLDRDLVCMCILVQLISMYLMGSLAAIALPVLSPKVVALPERRQKQLAIAVPVIIMKTAVMVLIMDSLMATTAFGRTHVIFHTKPSMEYRFQVLFFIAISYMFEVLQRPCSAELVLHHLYLQALPLYWWFWLRHRSPAQTELVTRFFELMVLFGPGATDITSDFTFLFYYCAPRSRSGLQVISGMSWLAGIMRSLQWIVLSAYGILKYDIAQTYLSPLEMGVFVLSTALWIWTELDEILKIRGMVAKFGQSLEQKRL